MGRSSPKRVDRQREGGAHRFQADLADFYASNKNQKGVFGKPNGQRGDEATPGPTVYVGLG